jgi:hypothetical protein
MFCALVLVFGSVVGVGSYFHVLRARTHFRRYRGRRIPFSCFALLDSFSTVPRVSGPFFMFCAPGLIFGGTVGVRSLFHILRHRTHIRWYRGRSFPFSCFSLPIMFSAIPRASSPVFMFLAPGLVFCGAECVGSHFHVLCSRTSFRRYRGRRDPFSCFALPDSFSAVPWVSGTVFMFCAPGLIFGGTVGVRSLFHILRPRTHIRWYRGRSFPFSCFSLPIMFSAIPRASSPVFMFFAPGLVFGDTEGVGSLFYVLRSRTRFRQFRGRRVPFS